MAIERSGDGLVRQVAAECIARLNGILNPEERGELALYVGTSETALDDGLESARLAMKRADFRVAIGRLRRALAIAKTLGTLGKAQEASLAIGNALYSLGQNLEARDALQRPEAWNSSLASDLMAIERELLLGRIARELGDAGAARTHFEKAIGTALAVGERSAWLTGCAELAEIDWDQGSESVRADAIAKRTVGRNPEDGASRRTKPPS
jgi:tetratricopeptide (TPR) repeat protein